jgi:uncharacterized SAM-binding protein YcdF (DUF218 family)
VNVARRHRRFLLAILVFVLGTLLIAGRYAGTALVASRPLDRPDAILVLASHEWERIPAAAERAVREPSAIVLLTRPRIVTEHNCHLCAEREEWLQALGVPAERIRLLARTVGNTRDEALAALPYCRLEGVRRLLIVTSPYHTRRALATFTDVFEGSGVEIGVEPSLPQSPARPDRWWAAAYDRWYVRYEWSALAFYLVRYGIIPAT